MENFKKYHEKYGFTGMKDVDYLILKELEDKDLLNMCQTNKYLNSLCNEEFWRQRFLSKFSNSPNYVKRAGITWAQLYKNAVQWNKLLNKFHLIGSMDDYSEIYDPYNVYDLLYNPEGNGNHDSWGHHLFNVDDPELNQYTPGFIFSDESALFELTQDLKSVDALIDHSYLPFDYAYLLEVLKRNERTLEEYEDELGYSSEWIKNYPQLFAEQLRKIPQMTNREKLREKLRKNTDNLVNWFKDELEVDEETVKELSLTDEEIDLILDLHERILNNDGLNILTEVKPVNLA
jgi:hypothetical protein